MDIKLAFGLHTDATIALVVNGRTSTPDLAPVVLTARTGPSPITLPYQGDGRWSGTVAPGDYVATLTVAPWFEGAVEVDAGVSVVFLCIDPGDKTIAWSDTVAVGRGDPKNPWPPPGVPVSLDAATFKWFDDHLHAVAVPKGGVVIKPRANVS